MQFVELVLTCASEQEAQSIADSLLEKKLVACAEFSPVTSRFSWKNKIENSVEIRLTMLSTADNFDAIETEATRLHSYETFVLRAMPMVRLSNDAQTWLAVNTKSS